MCPSPESASVSAATVNRLADQLHGELVRPSDPTYEQQRRVWNGSIDRHPAFIVRCLDTDDVVAAVRFGREAGVPVAVRAGGHSFPGHSVVDDGLVIDLSAMKATDIDLDRRVVRAQAGLRLGELDGATAPFDLVVPAGIVSDTGVAGLTLGGGIGWLQRSLGLTIDQLLSVEIVTADGDVLHASEDENPDLFWGVRGGGGNFGIVTEFEFRLSSIPPLVIAGPLSWPIADAPELMRFYRDWIEDAPDELMTILSFSTAQPAPDVPEYAAGKLVVNINSCYNGSLEEGRALAEQLRAFRPPLIDRSGPTRFIAHQSSADAAFVPGWWYYMRSCDVAELSDPVIDITVEYANRIVSPRTTFPIWQMGGAAGRVAEDATAFNGRGAGHTFNISCMTETEAGFDRERHWARDFWTALAPYHTSVYVNFLMEEGEERVRQAYGAEKYDRLKALKRRYDPDNFFRLNQNIAP